VILFVWLFSILPVRDVLVPSTFRSLTSVFEMGTGVSS